LEKRAVMEFAGELIELGGRREEMLEMLRKPGRVEKTLKNTVAVAGVAEIRESEKRVVGDAGCRETRANGGFLPAHQMA
jgi:hypothetical protein